ncbi:5-hydroxyisourate hydrolase [Amylibacter marinus]|uniref:5-hydroxyisourate hydrolase n=1 Tax=Amylibacter marinus TaxID=1475483 RepID=A0ABQ5VUV9_9RHOB|nr:hydroxyisourate hydrolase [Amylibacter marinus]GLQ35206.1 5-hydroxyisourate hydrolase [Amylibacter marinus]
MSQGYLTTHVLNTSTGQPAAGVKIQLFRVSGNSHRKIEEMVTNDDGRTDEPLLPPSKFRPGTYELVFYAGDYLRSLGTLQAEPLFLDQVPVRFGMPTPTHYHVPLLLSPFGYSTYRGS